MQKHRKYILFFSLTVIFFFLGFSTVWLEKVTHKNETDESLRYLASSMKHARKVNPLKNNEKNSARNKILNNFGSDLTIKITEDEKEVLISILGSNAKKDPKFDINVDRTIYDRATFVLRNIKPLLNYNPGYPLDKGVIKKNERTASVIFSQFSEKAIFRRAGKVEIHFGPEGELISVFSDYISTLKITNTFKLDPDEAKKQFQEYLHTQFPSEQISLEKIPFGVKVIWVLGSEGVRAYAFKWGGVEYILDATTASIHYPK